MKNKKADNKSGDEINVNGGVSKNVFVNGDRNVVNVHAKDKSKEVQKEERSQKNGTKKINVPIMVAWIGFFATILAALITVWGDDVPLLPLGGTATPITETATLTPSSIPTDTFAPVEPTQTAIPLTDTPIPTDTSIPPVPIGEDWIQGCVSTLWRAYPSSILPEERGNGCWQEPVHVFSAENGDLDFLFEREKGAPEIYGLFAPLPEKGIVTFTIRLHELSNVDLWMGVFDQPDVTSHGILMTILNGDVNRRAFVQKDPANYETLQGSQAIEQGNGYSISFRFDDLSATSIVNPSVFVTNSVSMPSTQKWLFLGYKGLSGYYRINGTFLNFKLEP